MSRHSSSSTEVPVNEIPTAGATIEAVWNDEARAAVRAGLVATGLSYAPVTADKVMPFLDKQADAWREHRTRACLAADIDDTLDAEHQGRTVWCLDDRRMDLGALVSSAWKFAATAPTTQGAHEPSPAGVNDPDDMFPSRPDDPRCKIEKYVDLPRIARRSNDVAE